MSASRNSALSSSTRCCSPTDRSSTLASGSTREPVVARRARRCARVPCRGRAADAAAQLVAEHDVLGDREHRDRAGSAGAPCRCRARSRRHELRNCDGLAVDARSRRRRAGTARRSRSSASSCPRRSRRAGSAPRRGAGRSRPRRWRATPGESLGDAARLRGRRRRSRLGGGLVHAMPWSTARAGPAGRSCGGPRHRHVASRCSVRQPGHGVDAGVDRAVGQARPAPPRAAVGRPRRESASWNGA